MTSIIIPNSVTSIGYAAFDGCSSLTSINIPYSVSSIDEKAFAMTELKEIYSYIENPFSINENVFTYSYANSSFIYDNATLYVPFGTKDKYKAATGWNIFKNIEEIVARGDANGDNEVSVTDIALVVNHILSLANESFYRYGADANGDGQVTVTDIGVIVDKILGTSGKTRRTTDDEQEPQ